MRKKRGATFSLVGFLLFLFPLGVALGFGIIIYHLLIQSEIHLWVIIILIGLYIVFTSLMFSLIDLYRRKTMIDEPVNRILRATQKIAMGDFDIKILPARPYSKYNEYDVIIDNINKMAKELSKSEILKSEFISNVSHELKTPLVIIQNYAKALQKDSIDEQTKIKYLQTLVTTSHKLSNLITNILKLNKLENQVIISKKVKINLGELLRESVLQFEDLISNKQINIDCNIKDISYICEPSFLQIIFNNLLSNAVKFTQDKGNIFVSLMAQGEYIEIIVKDDGYGMSKDVGQHIFEKFYQGETSHNGEGNGLGLALVKRVIDILGGEISVQSEINKGSTFTVKLKREIYE